MDWVYVWAYWRIADRPHLAERQGKRAPEMSAQLLRLAEAEWVEKEPKRGFGLWESSAWGTHAGFERAGIRDSRNFFLADKALVKKLAALATADRHRRLRRRLVLDFAGVFREDPEDVAALRELGFTPEQLKFRGFLMVGWGVPKGIVWLGLTPDRSSWRGTPEERAVELFLPPRRLPQPETILEEVARPPIVMDRAWDRVVARSHLAALGFAEYAKSNTEWTRDGRRYGRGPDVDEFLLVEPTTAELAVVRQRQVRGEWKPLWVLDGVDILRSASHFPWLWPWQHPPLTPWRKDCGVLPPHPRWTELHKLQLILEAARMLGVDADMDLVTFVWPDARDVEQLFSVLNGLAFSATGPKGYLPSIKGTRLKELLQIDAEHFLTHSALQLLLRRVTEWSIAQGNKAALTRAASVWRDHDTGLIERISQRLAELGYS